MKRGNQHRFLALGLAAAAQGCLLGGGEFDDLKPREMGTAGVGGVAGSSAGGTIGLEAGDVLDALATGGAAGSTGGSAGSTGGDGGDSGAGDASMDSMDLPDSSGEGDAATDAADGGVYASEAACPASFSGAPSAREISIGNAEGEKITKVPLVGAGSMTASFNSDQRLIWLDIAAKTASTVTVNIPFNDAVAPPGDHMVFVLKRNSRPGAPAIPSIGCWTKR